MNHDDLYLIAAGGTGIRVATALLYCCAYGALGKEKTLHIMVLDADNETGMEDITKQWKRYGNLRSIFQEGKNAPKQTELFAPSVDLLALPRILNYPSGSTIGIEWDNAKDEKGKPIFKTPDKLLLKALLCDYQVNALTPSDGLYGCPALGALLLDPKLQDDSVATFLRSCKNQPVALCASSFGGTGVAALECLLNRMKPGSEAPPSSKAIVLLQPYFTIKSAPDEKGTVHHWNDGECAKKDDAACAYFKEKYGNDLKTEPPAIAHAGARRTRGEFSYSNQVNWPEETEWRVAMRLCRFFAGDSAWRNLEPEKDKGALKAFARLAQVWNEVFEDSIDKECGDNRTQWRWRLTNALWTLPMPKKRGVEKRNYALEYDLPENTELREFFGFWQQWYLRMLAVAFVGQEKIMPAEGLAPKAKQRYWKYAKDECFDAKAKLVHGLFAMIKKEAGHNER